MSIGDRLPTAPGRATVDRAVDVARRVVADRSIVGWMIFVVGTVVMVILWLGPFDAHIRWVNGDQLTYQRIIGRMRIGEDYYRASVAVLRDHSAPRFIRTPVAFWFWAGSGLYSWPATLLVLVVCGALVGCLAWPVAGLGIEVWLVVLNHPIRAEQWGYNEVWALPFVLIAMLAVRRKRWWLATAAVLLAALIRETAVLFLIGGSIGALVLRKPLVPWVAACLAWSSFMAWHLNNVMPPSSRRRPPQLAMGAFGTRSTCSEHGWYPCLR